MGEGGWGARGRGMSTAYLSACIYCPIGACKLGRTKHMMCESSAGVL